MSHAHAPDDDAGRRLFEDRENLKAPYAIHFAYYNFRVSRDWY